MIADIVQTGLTSWWAFALAFAAGVVSFASPCVFPLVPGYLSFVTGERAEGDRGIGSMLLFVGGFTVVFVAVFGFTDVFLQVVRGTAGRIVTGTVIALFGTLLLLYAFERGPIGLYAERRPFLGRVAGGVGAGPAWAFPLGMAFAAGWTPCIGPVLAAITALAAGQGSAAAGGLPAGHVLARARAPVRARRTGREAIHGRVRLHPAQLPVDRGRLRRADGRDRRPGRDGAVGSPARAAAAGHQRGISRRSSAAVT